ncbi:MAG TPA: hypothetical protein PKA20_20755 [Burkholderiaceae bacterium]|nr:hypothetical protein [Burkholderiaceae bacterium]
MAGILVQRSRRGRQWACEADGHGSITGDNGLAEPAVTALTDGVGRRDDSRRRMAGPARPQFGRTFEWQDDATVED